MVNVKEDLTGRRFGKLTVVKQGEDFIAKNGTHIAAWLCLCDCSCEQDSPKLVRIRGNDLKSGKTKSCGCLLKEAARRMGSTGQKENKRDLSGDYGILWTTNTNEEVYFDLEDAENILKYSWRKDARGYVSAEINRRSVKMHHFLGYKNHDHKNRNKLDNRKDNLRPCTQQENCRNRSLQKNNKSGFTGVYFDKNTGKWTAQIKINKKTIKLGSFIDKDDAVRTRLKAVKDVYGEFSSQQHLYEEYNI